MCQVLMIARFCIAVIIMNVAVSMSCFADLARFTGTIDSAEYFDHASCRTPLPVADIVNSHFDTQISYTLVRPIDGQHPIFGIESFKINSQGVARLEEGLGGSIVEYTLPDGTRSVSFAIAEFHGFLSTAIDIGLFGSTIDDDNNGPHITMWRDATASISIDTLDGFDCRFSGPLLSVDFFPGGDANYDHRFDTSDLVNVFQAGEYEDGIADNSRWADGDWNADRDFDTNDLVLVFQEGRYETQQPAASVNGKTIVPEPTSGLLGSCVVIFMIASSRGLRRRAG